MARTVRDYRLETRSQRDKLKSRPEPYWVLLSEGFHLGYYKGSTVTKWVARHRQPGQGRGYRKTTLGEADDNSDANGSRVLDYRQAQDRAREWLGTVEGGVTANASYTVGNALDDYLAAFTGKDLANTKRRIEQFIRPALGGVKLSKLTSAQVRAFHNERASTPARLRSRTGDEQKFRPLDTADEKRKRKATANRILTVLKAALNLAYANERIATDRAWKAIKPFEKVDGVRLRFLADDEARRLVNAAQPDFRPIVQASLLTGARWGELRSLRVEDADLDAGTIRLVDTKSGTSRHAYLEGEGRELFHQFTVGKKAKDLIFPGPDGERWADSTQVRRMAEASVAGKVDPPATFHDLRRSFGAKLARAGVSMQIIAEALGHADQRITGRHYAHLAKSHVSETVRENIAGLCIVAKSNVARIV